MMKLHRPDAPDWLMKKWETWGEDYHQKKSALPNHSFRWRTYQKMPVNQHLVPILREMTKDHCAFCDLLPVVPYTIEHFRPKSDSRYYLLAYQWENLFICCGYCQQAKSELFDELLLKPDELTYEYNQYFLCDPVTGLLEPNPKATEADQARATVTINLYKLNDFGRPTHRKREIKKYALKERENSNILGDTDNPNLTMDDFSFRFMFL